MLFKKLAQTLMLKSGGFWMGINEQPKLLLWLMLGLHMKGFLILSQKKGEPVSVKNMVLSHEITRGLLRASVNSVGPGKWNLGS